MRLLDQMPFTEYPKEVIVRDERVRVRANQIVIWVSLGLHRIMEPNPAAVPFPAILDTGHTHSFSIQQRHLVEWAGLRPESLAILGAVRDAGQRLDLLGAQVWIHPSQRGQHEPSVDQPPHRILAPRGIAVYPIGDFPRLPLLGLRALADNRLILKADGNKRFATLRTARRWWLFS
jgi:hypothetical protein